jgi:hypothetical protein
MGRRIVDGSSFRVVLHIDGGLSKSLHVCWEEDFLGGGEDTLGELTARLSRLKREAWVRCIIGVELMHARVQQQADIDGQNPLIICLEGRVPASRATFA